MRYVYLEGIESPASVIALSRREWRVSDPTMREQDGLALLGFVEQVENRYEVTPMNAPRQRTLCPSLEDAVNRLVRSGGRAA